MKLFFFFRDSRSFFFSSPEYQIYAKRIELLHIQIELSFSEKKSVSQISSKVCKKTFKGKNRATALHVIPDDRDLLPLSHYLPPIEEMKGTIVGNDYQKPLDFGFLKRAFDYLSERDLLNIVLHECFQKILFFKSKHQNFFSNVLLMEAGPWLGIYISTGFLSSSIPTLLKLVIPNSLLLSPPLNPTFLFLKRSLSILSVSFQLCSLCCYLPILRFSPLAGEKPTCNVSSLLFLGGTLTSLGSYAQAVNFYLEGNSAHIKIKLVSQLVNELTNIVYKNWVIASLHFQVPLLMANQLLEYNQKFLFKQVSLNNYHLNFVVNQIQAIANIRKTYSIQNPLSLVSISEFPTVSVTLLKLANGKQLLIGGKAAEIIDTVLLLGSNCGTTVALFKK